MTSAERRVVHERLKDYDGVETASEGDEPHRLRRRPALLDALARARSSRRRA